MLLTEHQQDIIKQSREKNRVREAWDQWLKGFNPSHVCHLWFSRTTSHEEAMRAFRDYYIKINSRAGGGTRAVAATERCPTSGRLHIHALLVGAEDIPRDWLENKWGHGNRNHVEAFDPSLGRGGLYAVKSNIHDNDGVITFFPNNWRV
jgi:hypothetical protein